MRRRHALLLIAALIAPVLACSGPDTFHVTSFQLGRSLNADSTVGIHATTFGPSDTVYVSVLTAGVGNGTLGVRWTHAGRVIGEPKKQVSSRDGSAFEFNLQSAVGFPPGDYSVEILLDGASVGSRAFRVQAGK